MQKHTPFTISAQHLIPTLLLAGLVFLGYIVLSEFLLTLIWAFILAYVTWPLYKWLNRRINNANISAAIMTMLLALTILIIISWFASLLQTELKDTYQRFVVYLAQDHHPLPDIVNRIPWLGTYLQDLTSQLTGDPAGFTAQLSQWGRQLLRQLAVFLGGIGSYTLKTGVVLVTVFFLLSRWPMYPGTATTRK